MQLLYPKSCIPSSWISIDPRQFRSLFFWLLLGLTLFAATGIQVGAAFASEKPVVHHNLSIQILPDIHTISARDTLIIKASDWSKLTSPLRLTLNRHLTVEEVQSGTKSVHFSLVEPTGDTDERENFSQIIEISDLRPSSPSKPISLSIRYKGKVHDPPRPSNDLRFVRPDKTLGHIGPDGIYLTTETAWYPDVPDTLSTFSIEVTLPQGWMAVTQGIQVSHQTDSKGATAIWEVNVASEALTFAANRFVKHHRDWHGIELATYLFAEDSHLSEQYLDATAQYLEVYTALLGPYPFQKFAVVENFFPSGLGLPSFTLLGSRVIKRGYTQPYSLGHEIVHSWIGNSVFNNFTKGNWVEGLTTYLANYYYEELHGPSDAPLKNRRRMLFEYNLYAPPSEEYPLIQFHHKETRIDNAIGYQKSAMVFHMLRQEIGDEPFFSGIRLLVREKSGSYADWDTLEQVFQKTAGRKLGWFFTQWVEQPGTPSIQILKSVVLNDQQSGKKRKIELTLEQSLPPYQLNLPIDIDLANGSIYETSVRIKDQKPTVVIPVPGKPTFLKVDPKFNTFRRLQRDQIPPMLNIWTTDQTPIIILPDESFRNESSIYRPILDRLQSRDLQVIVQRPNKQTFTEPHSHLILDDPKTNHLTPTVIRSCPENITLKSKSLTIREQTFEGSSIAWLISCPHPARPGNTLTVFSGFSDAAVARVARLLFFYGWDSYLVFDDGKVVSRGIFDIINKDLAVTLPAT